MKKVILIGTICAMLAGCVGTSIPTPSDCDDAETSMEHDYTYPNLRIDKLFGIDSEVLTNTNLFPVTENKWHHYHLILDGSECGFTTCSIHLNQDEKTGQLSLDYISFNRVLNPGSNDNTLLREYQNTLNWLNEKLGTDMTLDLLNDLKKMRDHHNCVKEHLALGLCHTSVYANLDLGQQIHVAGHDAVFMKRGDEYVEMTPPTSKLHSAWEKMIVTGGSSVGSTS